MDAFYASIEQLDNPELSGKPVVVGSPESRGVIAAASYEARKYGIRSAMPSNVAGRLCPGLIFVKHRMKRYRQVSDRIFDIFHSFTPVIEALSIDEAFLDATAVSGDFDEAIEIAKGIGSKNIIARAYLELGFLFMEKKRIPDARQCLIEAINIFKQCESKFFINQAKETLKAIESPSQNDD